MRPSAISPIERWTLSVGRFPRVASLLFFTSVLCLLTSVALCADHLGRDDTLRDNTTGDKAVLNLHDFTTYFSPTVYVGGGTLTIGTALPASSNIIGNVRIDQTTPGTTNGIAINANPSTTAATPTQGVKAVATAGTPVALVASTTKVESVEIFARKNTTTANTGNVYVGFSSTAGQNYRVLQPGESFSMSAPSGKKIDLNLIYIDAATNADAVVYTAVN